MNVKLIEATKAIVGPTPTLPLSHAGVGSRQFGKLRPGRPVFSGIIEHRASSGAIAEVQA